MIKLNFKNKIRLSFRKVKKDISGLRSYIEQWVTYLNNNQEDMNKRVEALEEKISRIEEKKELIKL